MGRGKVVPTQKPNATISNPAIRDRVPVGTAIEFPCSEDGPSSTTSIEMNTPSSSRANQKNDCRPRRSHGGDLVRPSKNRIAEGQAAGF